MKNKQCLYCENLVEKPRLKIGLELCLKCAGFTKRVREHSSSLGNLHHAFDLENQMSDVKSLASTLKVQ